MVMEPLPDQKIAIDKLRQVPARLCGDSMGVGKTVTGIGLDMAMREDDPVAAKFPTLIIPEKIGIDVWDWHLKEMGINPKRILAVDPSKRSDFEDALASLRAAQRGRGKGVPWHYWICHWDAISRIEDLTAKVNGKPAINWAHVIADEVHLAKNRKAQRTVALKRIATMYKTGLSGTPADDKPQDFWSILHWLYPKDFRSYWRFFNTYLESEAHPVFGYRIVTGVKNIDDLHRKIRPFYIRRTLLDVAPNMPDKVHVQPPIRVKLTGKQRKEYESMRDKALAELGSGEFTLLAPAVIAVITRLQQMALATLSPEWEIPDDAYTQDEDEDPEWDAPKIVLSKPSPKLDAVMNLIETHEEESFVVFTQFRGMADLVEEECIAKKIPVVKVHGELTSKEEVTKRVSMFQDGQARVFVGTIGKAGKTITLTRASHVIFTDLSWNPSKNEQAEDRLWRRTQKRSVQVHVIEAEDTIDQYRANRIATKGRWIQELLSPPRRAVS